MKYLKRFNETRNENVSQLVESLDSSYVSTLMKDLINKKQKYCLKNNIDFLIEDMSSIKFDIEIEEDFGENLFCFYDKDEKEWILNNLDDDYSKIICGWQIPKLENGNMLIITNLESAIICVILNQKNMQNGIIESNFS